MEQQSAQYDESENEHVLGGPLHAVLAFGLPFKFWNVVANVPQYGTESTRPSSIIGAQINPGSFTTADRIVNQNTAQFAYRLAPGNNYTGTLETAATMTPAMAAQTPLST